jgi:tRNA modification GTPase
MKNNAFYGDEAPIAACATAFAETALSLIRVSGKGCIERLASCFSRPLALREAAGNTVVYGWIVDGGAKIDETLVSVFRAPKSYTGEESMDISCHGGLAAGRAVLAALQKCGIRQALPGEFSFRAFMNGKIDLTRAESVMEIVAAKSDAGRSGAVSRLSGLLYAEIERIKTLLVQVLSEMELLLDYSELDGVGTDTGRLPGMEIVGEAKEGLAGLLRNYIAERLYREGALVVIAGPPNAGKSSLFNLLLREERSIVSAAPGTTRDWIEGWISLQNIPIRLVDTAGLRESSDTAEKIGVERSYGLLEKADLVIFVHDGGAEEENPVNLSVNRGQKAPFIEVWNKSDLSPAPENAVFVPISSKTGEGLATLCENIVSSLVKSAGASESVSSALALGTERQKELITCALAGVEKVLSMEAEGRSADLVAPELREAVNALGEMTGEVSSADILEVMFSRFCVGK